MKVKSFADLGALLALSAKLPDTPAPEPVRPARQKRAPRKPRLSPQVQAMADYLCDKPVKAKTRKPKAPKTKQERGFAHALSVIQRDDAACAKINEKVKAKWGSLSRPEPKSILDPVPPAMIRFEGPRKRVKLDPNRNPDKVVGALPQAHPMTGGGLHPNYLVGGNFKTYH